MIPEWSVVAALLVQTLILAYSYGKLTATVSDNVQRLKRIEKLIDAWMKR